MQITGGKQTNRQTLKYLHTSWEWLGTRRSDQCIDNINGTDQTDVWRTNSTSLRHRNNTLLWSQTEARNGRLDKNKSVVQTFGFYCASQAFEEPPIVDQTRAPYSLNVTCSLQSRGARRLNACVPDPKLCSESDIPSRIGSRNAVVQKKTDSKI